MASLKGQSRLKHWDFFQSVSAVMMSCNRYNVMALWWKEGALDCKTAWLYILDPSLTSYALRQVAKPLCASVVV